MLRRVRFFLLFFFLITGLISAQNDRISESDLFPRYIQPILQNKCYMCHSADQKMGGLSLENRESLLKGGKSGPAIIEGHSETSLVVQLVTGKDPDRFMPLSGTKLTETEIQHLKTWIDKGAVWPVKKGPTSTFRTAPLEPRNPRLPENRNNTDNPIDLLLQSYYQSHKIKPDVIIDDRRFIRRVYLDCIGLLPPPKKIQSFILDSNPDKRKRLVDELLSRKKEYAEHWLSIWNDWLRNAYRGTGFIDDGRKQITSWLYHSLRENKPFDQMVSELIDPTTGTQGFIKGIIWRGVVNASQRPEMQAAQNISQVFMGINLKCASCHDSFINQWKLKDSYNLASVFSKKPLELVRCDKPTGDLATPQFLYPQLGTIDNQSSSEIRRKQLAQILTSPQNGRFSRTLVNRLWAYCFGRGIVEPVDDMDAPAWNQDLLDWLAYDFASHGYDIQRTMKWIFTSKAYQRPAADRHTTQDEFVFQGPLRRRLSAEQLIDAISQITESTFLIPSDFFQKDGRGQGGQGQGTVLSENRNMVLFSSGKIRAGTIPIHLNIENIQRIYLVSTSNQEGDTLSSILWSNPQYRNKNHDIQLTHFSGFRSIHATGKEPGICSSPLGGEGISVPSLSVIDFPVPAHYSIFSCTVVLPDRGKPPQDKTQYEILVLGDLPDIRTVHLNNDSLQKALGRPNREQVVTRRNQTPTTLQALELSNGQTLFQLIQQGIHNLQVRHSLDNSSFISMIFWRALGRAPSEKEMSLSRSLIEKRKKQEGLEDLLWIVCMLPEFQWID